MNQNPPFYPLVFAVNLVALSLLIAYGLLSLSLSFPPLSLISSQSEYFPFLPDLIQAFETLTVGLALH